MTFLVKGIIIYMKDKEGGKAMLEKWGKVNLGQLVIPMRDAFLPGIPPGTQGKVVRKTKYTSGDVIYDVEFIVRKVVVMRAHESEIELVFEAIPPWAYEIPMEDLALPVRTLHSLMRAGFYNVGEVLERFQKGDKEMLDIRNFGKKSLDELKQALLILFKKRVSDPKEGGER